MSSAIAWPRITWARELVDDRARFVCGTGPEGGSGGDGERDRAEVIGRADAAFRTTDYFRAVSLPIAARAALWAGAADEASAVIDELAGPGMRGQAIALDITTLRAGLAALEGRRSDAIAGYREALRGWRQLGLAFDEALAALDLAILLAPTEREMAEAPAAIDAARETLARIEARPLLARLDAGPTVADRGVAR